MIPTYNAEQYLEQCLESIKALEYPKNKIEIIIADGGSTDKTLDIARKYPVKIVNNSKKIAEYGKKLAFDASHGKYIALLDSDNVIVNSDWLLKLLAAFQDPKIIGVESAYLINNNFTSLNKYANSLVIVDPLARMLATKPVQQQDRTSYSVKIYKKGSSVVAGANGFLWRRSIIDKYNASPDELSETNLLLSISSKIKVQIGFVNDVGIYHYYCSSVRDYLKKRKKIANKHITRTQSSTSWVDRTAKLKFYLAVLYLVTIIGPSLEATVNVVKYRKLYWFWHPLISFATIVQYTRVYLGRALSSE